MKASKHPNMKASKRHRRVILPLLAGIALITFFSTPARGAVILNTTFPGTAGGSPYNATWTDGGGFYNPAYATLNGSGSVGFNQPVSPSGTPGIIAAAGYAYQPTGLDHGQLDVAFNFPNDGAARCDIGLNLFGEMGTRISVTNAGGAFWLLQIRNDTVGSNQFSTISKVPTTTMSGTWGFSWFTDKVVISLNGAAVFDTSVTAPEASPGTGGPAWFLPTVALVPNVDMYMNSGNTDLYISSVTWASVPEPSTISFAILGACLITVGLYRQRRRQQG